jgi:6-phosphogluconolactonase (cycloisomerase 2 family)
MRLYFGTYPHDIAEFPEEGIWYASLDASSAQITDLQQKVELSSPSFITWDRDHSSVIAVSENPEGGLTELTVTDEELEIVARVSTRGAHPCHVIVAGGQAIVTNYGSGSVFSQQLPLAQDSQSVSGRNFQQTGTGPVADRQEGPHAHFAGQLPGSQYVWVADLGADRIFRYAISQDSNGAPTLDALGSAVEFPGGMGPRHIACGLNGHAYVVGELDGKVYTVAYSTADGSGQIVWDGLLLEDAEQEYWASHVELSADQKRLYVALRGVDQVVVFDVVDDGSLRRIASAPVIGAWPRHFRVIEGTDALAGHDIIVVANQNSHTVDVLSFDATRREFSERTSVRLPSPACVLPVEA